MTPEQQKLQDDLILERAKVYTAEKLIENGFGIEGNIDTSDHNTTIVEFHRFIRNKEYDFVLVSAGSFDDMANDEEEESLYFRLTKHEPEIEQKGPDKPYRGKHISYMTWNDMPKGKVFMCHGGQFMNAFEKVYLFLKSEMASQDFNLHEAPTFIN